MVNSPVPTDLAGECRKAARTLNSFIKPTTQKGNPDSYIPPNIIARAKGLAIMTVIKAGFVWSGRVGSGIVVARLSDGTWSAPSAIGTAGMGVGGQIGAELVDFVIILNTPDAVKAFSHGGNLTLGGNLSVAAGPLGRNAEVAGTLGDLAAIYSYSKSKGLFAGISLEGSAIIERKDDNAKFYQRRIGAQEILSGKVARPAAAAELYKALDAYTGERAATSAAGSSSQPPPYVPRSPTSPTSPTTVPVITKRPSISTPNPNTTTPPSLPPRSSKTISAVALFDYIAERPDDLSFKKGDIIVITKKTPSSDDWWQGMFLKFHRLHLTFRSYTGTCNGRSGNFPANYISPLQ